MTTAVSSSQLNHKLISLWFLVSSLVVAWDVSYILLRPRSMKGGDLHWIWSPYSLYMEVDYIYGLPSWTSNDGFPAAQSMMNVVECAINFFYLYLVHVVASPKSRAIAPMVGLIAATMTTSKTVLYMLNDYSCGWCQTGHNPWPQLVLLFIVPNGMWILVPSLVALYFIRQISRSLQVAAKLKGTVESPTVYPSPNSVSVSAAKLLEPKAEQTGHPSFTRLKTSWLIHHSKLPDWAKDNAFIKTGYRRPGGSGDKSQKMFEHDSYRKCWNSIWAYWHNETVNIHTHMWGAVFSVGLSCLHLLQSVSLLPSVFGPLSHHPIFYPSSLTFTTAAGKQLRLASASYPSASDAPSLFSSLSSTHLSLPVRSPDFLDIIGFSTFFLASLICLGFSATYHTVSCHSRTVARTYNKLDYIGIVIMIVGSFLPALHYGFYCHPHFQLTYSIAIVLLASVAMYLVIAPKYVTPAYRPYRTFVFLALGLSAVFPVAHVIHVYGHHTVTTIMGLEFLVLSGSLYVVGALLYMLRIPERFYPGTFDLIGSSHQVFHCLIVLAAIAHYISLRKSYAFWHTVESVGGGFGREAVCRALEA